MRELTTEEADEFYKTGRLPKEFLLTEEEERNKREREKCYRDMVKNTAVVRMEYLLAEEHF